MTKDLQRCKRYRYEVSVNHRSECLLIIKDHSILFATFYFMGTCRCTKRENSDDATVPET